MVIARVVILAAALLLCAGGEARANLDFFIYDYVGPNARGYEITDVLDIQDARGFLTVPNVASPYRIVRVITTRTKASVIAYMVKGSTKRRAYYLDPARMSAADRAYWDANRAIQADEATAISWITRKTGQ